jgi:GPH family glycoside/pentoside/hexuronide:cation symporter
MKSEKLSVKTKWLYGAGDFGFSLTDTTIGILYAIFLTDVVGLMPKQAALAVFLGKSWDYINDPLIGYISDRTRSRWGRRRPYLLFGFLPFALAFMALWWIPPLENDFWLVAYYTVAYIVFDAAATFVYMPYFALTPELTLDYDERTSLTSYRMFFSIFASLIAFTVPLAVIGTMRPQNSGRVLAMAIAVGLASALPLLLTFIGTQEREEFIDMEQPSIRASIKAAAKNRPFIYAMGIFLFTWSAIEIVQTMLLYFLKYRLSFENESDIIAGSIFITALITLPFWSWASRQTDKRRAYILGMIFLSGVLTTLAFITPTIPFWGVISLAVLAGIGIGGVHVLPWSIIPDAIEWDELETGARHEGMFYSLVTLFRKVATSIGIPLALLILDWSGYVSNAAVQKPSAIKAIMMMTGPIPAFFMFLGIIFAIYYPLSRERHAEIRSELEQRKHLVSE